MTLSIARSTRIHLEKRRSYPPASSSSIDTLTPPPPRTASARPASTPPRSHALRYTLPVESPSDTRAETDCEEPEETLRRHVVRKRGRYQAARKPASTSERDRPACRSDAMHD